MAATSDLIAAPTSSCSSRWKMVRAPKTSPEGLTQLEPSGLPNTSSLDGMLMESTHQAAMDPTSTVSMVPTTAL
jgi:hypothetical protein